MVWRPNSTATTQKKIETNRRGLNKTKYETTPIVHRIIINWSALEPPPPRLAPLKKKKNDGNGIVDGGVPNDAADAAVVVVSPPLVLAISLQLNSLMVS
mmetsp:Transcript_22072/g.51908  ORF Transcript_22072/g.51908 Transcript_22072/m.51908 type:complete len:99 (-) Transcript_22072:480-776(-)